MKRYRFHDMRGGWFVGDFEPTAFRTGAAEVCLKRHPQGEAWPAHSHAIATEINLLVRGRMQMGSQVFEAGDIFVMEPGDVADPEFLTDCELVVVKVPSVPKDKHLLALSNTSSTQSALTPGSGACRSASPAVLAAPDARRRRLRAAGGPALRHPLPRGCSTEPPLR